MSLSINLNGKTYTNFTSASVYVSMESVCRSFSFVSTASADNSFPIKAGDQVDILADDIPVIKGYVERLQGKAGKDAHDITVSGRSTMADLVDSTVGSTKQFEGVITLASIVQSVLSDLGLSSTSVIDNSGGVSFSETDIQSADVGQAAFEFLESYARKKQVLILEDGDGNLVLTQASGDEIGFSLKNVINGNDNNILSSAFSLDLTERYNIYKVQSQLNLLLQAQGITPDVASSQTGTEAEDKDIRDSRIYEFNMEESGDSQTAADRAIWESNIRRARSMSYVPVVQGHSVGTNGSSILWDVNKLINIVDNFWDISSQLLIRAATYEYNFQKGSTTTLDLTYKDAYTLQASQDAREANTNEQGFSFLS